MSETRPCKQCGLDVLIVEVVNPETQNIRTIALDPRVQAYHVVKDQDGPDLSVKASKERVLAYHGAVCKGVKRGSVP